MIHFACDDYGSGIVENVRVSRDGYEWFQVVVPIMEDAALFMESVDHDQKMIRRLEAENESLRKQVQDIRSSRKVFADSLAEKILGIMESATVAF